MFDKLFRSGRWCNATSSPLLQERLEYLQHCANQGYGLTTLRELAAKRWSEDKGLMTFFRSL